MDENAKTFRWGIIGCGLIAPRLAKAVEESGEGRVVSAASKSMRRARRFQRETGVERVHGSYEEMLEREALDAVYVATTHNFHAENARLCLERGIPVLVEKPFTQNARQAEAVIALARDRRLFCMEAMWTRFNPASRRLCAMLADGVIGEIRLVQGDFRVRMHPLSPKMMPWNRMYSPRLAGGALLDLGIYPVAFLHMLMGRPPETVEGSATMTWTGVDKSSEYRFGYPGGARAELSTSFVSPDERDMVITGTRGSIVVPHFYRADRFILRRNGEPEQTIECGEPSFVHQVREVHRCLREGLGESPLMRLDETLANMRTLDALRTHWGMRYPGE